MRDVNSLLKLPWVHKTSGGAGRDYNMCEVFVKRYDDMIPSIFDNISV